MKRKDNSGKWNRRTNFHIKYLGNMTIASIMFGGMGMVCIIRVAAAAPAPASGRADSSATIVIDAASSGTVRSTTYNKQKLEAAVDRATYSR